MIKLKLFACTILVTICGNTEVWAQSTPTYLLDVPYVPTPEVVVDEMLKLAGVDGSDVLVDLGSGDGRIPIIAAKQFGIRAVGVELDPARIREANQNAIDAKVADRVNFYEEDIFEFDFSKATVVTMYLFPEVNLKLRPKLLQMEPGTRIVSHKYNMGDWEPDQVKTIIGSNGREHTIYLWRVPQNLMGEMQKD